MLAPTKHPPDPAGITAVNRWVPMIVFDGNKLLQQHGKGDSHLKKVRKKTTQEDNILQFLMKMHYIFIYQKLYMVLFMTIARKTPTTKEPKEESDLLDNG